MQEWLILLYVKFFLDIPDCFHRMITSFSKRVRTGNVICKLSIISTISPQTCVSAHTRGIPRTNIIITKEKHTRISGPSLPLAIPSVSGHKPINSKLRRFSSIAHIKSLKQNSYFNKTWTMCVCVIAVLAMMRVRG